jgi:hypothetical protein
MKSTYKAPKGQKPGADVKSFPGASMNKGSKVIKSSSSNLMKGATSSRPYKGSM